jgi:hypothetical protein
MAETADLEVRLGRVGKGNSEIEVREVYSDFGRCYSFSSELQVTYKAIVTMALNIER